MPKKNLYGQIEYSITSKFEILFKECERKCGFLIAELELV